MNDTRAHLVPLARQQRALLAMLLACAPLLGAADCLFGRDDEARKKCEAVCAAEAGCPFGRSTADCLNALCTKDGFRSVTIDGTAVRLGDLPSTSCTLRADTCADLVLCTCEDACGRDEECTGDPNATCETDCAAIAEQAPDATYTENRCKIESTCDDLPVCGSVGG